MSQQLSISVIIANYNRSALLKKAIESVLMQTYPVLEIVVCDDGSTDDSKEIVGGFNSSIIKWMNCGKNGRPAIPRNIGIKNAQGNYIAFLDNDDEWLPTKLEEQITIIINKNAIATCSNAYRITEISGNELFYKNTTDNRYSFTDLIHNNQIICSSMLIEKNSLLSSSLFPEAQHFKAIEDYLLWLQLSLNIEFYYCALPLVKYRDIPHTSIRSNDDELKQEQTIFNFLKQQRSEMTNQQYFQVYWKYKAQRRSKLQRLVDFEYLYLYLKNKFF